MLKGKRLVSVFAIAMLYASLYLLPYIRYVFYDALVSASGFTNTQIGVTMTVALACGFVFTPISGWLADRFKLKWQMIAAGVIHVIISFIYPSVITSYPLTLLIWGLTAITGVLLFWSQVFKLIRMIGSANRDKTFGIFEGAIGFWSMLFSFIGLFIYSRFANDVSALKGVVYFYGVTSAIGTVLTLIFYDDKYEREIDPESKKEKRKATTKEIISVFKLPEVWILSIVVFAIYGIVVGSSYFTPYFSGVLGVTVVFAGAMATLKSYGVRVIGGPVGGFISAKLGTVKFQIIAFIIMVIFMVVFMLLPPNPALVGLVTALMLIMAFVNFTQRGSMWAIMDGMNIPINLSGIAIACASLIGITLPDLILPPLFGSWLDKYNSGPAAYRLIFGFTTIMLIVGMLCLIWVGVRMKRRKAKQAAPDA